MTDLSNKSVQVGVSRPLNVKVPPADVVDGFVVDHECAVGVLEGRVRGQDGVVWLHHRCGDLEIEVKLDFWDPGIEVPSYLEKTTFMVFR